MDKNWQVAPLPVNQAKEQPVIKGSREVVSTGLRTEFSAIGMMIATWLIGLFFALIMLRADIFYKFFAAGFLVCGVVLFLLIFGESAFYFAERKLKWDMNNDGYQGQPPVSDTRYIPVRSAASYTMTPREHFIEFIRSCRAGTSEERWFPLVGEKQYGIWRDWLLTAGYAKWRNRDHHQGWDLAGKPDEIIGKLPDDATLPLSLTEDEEA